MTTPAVILDLDGTLVDSEPDYFKAMRRLLAAHGVHDYSRGHHARYTGISTKEALESLRDEYKLSPPVEELLDAKNRLYLKLSRACTEVFWEMKAFVESLHAAGHPLAVASGSSRETIGTVLAAAGLDTVIHTVVSAEEVERGKPHPDIFLEAARRLGADPADCVVVEDAPPGATAAQRAGMRCIAVPYLPEQADDPAFTAVGLLFAGGLREFDGRAAYDWIIRG